jgi:hypothetical protein
MPALGWASERGLGLFGGPNGPPLTSGGQDPTWDSAVANHEAYRQKQDPPFDDGVRPLPFHVVLDAGVEYLKPILDRNTAFVHSQVQTVGRATQLTSGLTSFTFQGQATPRVSLGVFLDSGWGFRAGWLHFGEGSDTFSLTNFDRTGKTVIRSVPVFGIPGFSSPGSVAQSLQVFQDTMSFGSHLETQVVDSDICKTFDLGPWHYLVSAGGRYTYLSQAYSAVRVNRGKGVAGTSRTTITLDCDMVTTGHNFDGFGPTGALEVQRSLGRWGLALYGVGRSSVLFGRGRTRSQQITIENFQTVSAGGSTKTTKTTVELDASRGHDDDLPVEELEIGCQWSHSLERLSWQVRVGFVYDLWINAGNATSEQGDLSFLGLSLTAGLSY